jgi:hypothetical protein
MATQTLTLKVPFLRLNAAQAAEFARLQDLNTKVANGILAMSQEERSDLTTAHFTDVEIGSAWMNQTIRNARARTKAKRFRVMLLETNNQNWTLYKVGDTYSVGFNLLRGMKKRIPLEVCGVPYRGILDALLEGRAKQGSLKLWWSRRGIWYALLSVSMEVPDVEQVRGWIGVDRGQRHLAVASSPEGTPLFLTFRVVRAVRRHYAAKRRRLQKARKRRTVKRLERKEARFVQHVNHVISNALVRFAQAHGCGIRLEDLTGIRRRTRQVESTVLNLISALDSHCSLAGRSAPRAPATARSGQEPGPSRSADMWRAMSLHLLPRRRAGLRRRCHPRGVLRRSPRAAAPRLALDAKVPAR